MSSSQFMRTIELLEGMYHTPVMPSRRAGLRRIYRLLSMLEEPHKSFRSVHIAGSTGKGSTTSMASSILSASGQRTGTFRSPHLVSYTERITLDGEDIVEDAWVETFDQVWPSVERLSSNSAFDYALGRPSLIEVLFAMACVYFRRRGVPWAAIETGLGGRFDPTNTLAPDVAVITNVSLEHTQVLGPTVRAIAGEKAAIIKPGSHSVTASEDEDALDVVAVRAGHVRSPLTIVGHQVRWESSHRRLDSQIVKLSSPATSLEVSLPVGGRFQAVNAATAFAAIQSLRTRGVPIEDEAVVRGLEDVVIPGRLEVRSRNPLVIFDGAHNPAAARELAATLTELMCRRPIRLVFAAMADKDIEKMVAALAPIAKVVYVTQVPGTDRAAAPEVLANAFYVACVHTEVVPDADEALKRACQDAEGGDAIVVAGSMYLVGWLRNRVKAGSV